MKDKNQIIELQMGNWKNSCTCCSIYLCRLLEWYVVKLKPYKYRLANWETTLFASKARIIFLKNNLWMVLAHFYNFLSTYLVMHWIVLCTCKYIFSICIHSSSRQSILNFFYPWKVIILVLILKNEKWNFSFIFIGYVVT